MIKKFNKFNEGNEPVQNEDDINFLNKLFGEDKFDNTSKTEPEKPEQQGDPKEGDKITYYRNESEYDGKSGKILGFREDGKISLRFDDGKRFAANAKNVYKYGEKPDDKTKKPNETKGGVKLFVYDTKADNPTWGPGAFEVPDTFYGSKGAPEITKKNFKKGDKIVFKKTGSEYNNKTGSFIEQRSDGKLSIRFDDGKRFAANPKSVFGSGQQVGGGLRKNEFILKIGNLPDEGDGDLKEFYKFGVFIMLNNGNMYDGELANQYPELANMELEEEKEGFLGYAGELDKEELADDLKERGFRVEIIEGNLW